jgi:hypothetical protein
MALYNAGKLEEKKPPEADMKYVFQPHASVNKIFVCLVFGPLGEMASMGMYDFNN